LLRVSNGPKIMEKKFNLKTGKLGEEIAKDYLENKGFKILGQNCKTRFAEIDLIVQKGKEKILVEVRTRRGNLFGTPEESLTKNKLRKLRLNARAIGAERIDAVCIVLGQNDAVEKLEHYENIC